jgi:penicillin-binding protein 2
MRVRFKRTVSSASFIAVCSLILLAACGQASGPLLGATPDLPTPVEHVTSAPDVASAAEHFLSTWKAGDSAALYLLLAQASTNDLSQDDFAKSVSQNDVALTAQSLDYQVLSALPSAQSAKVAYRITWHTALFGDIERQTEMQLNLENGAWKVVWAPSMVLPELQGNNRLSRDSRVPGRANIYDSNGNVLAAQSDVVTFGVIPGQLNPDQEGNLLGQLSELTGKTPQAIKALYENAAPDWYVPVGEASADIVDPRQSTLSSISGLQMERYSARYYYGDGVAAHVIGYVQPISPELMDQYQRQGYQGNEKVGMAGVEKWAEPYLAGKPGADLYIVDPQGQILTRLAHADPQPSQSVYTTLDRDFQAQAQKAIAGFRGAVVVLERDTGKVLAMASSPTFDPNLFDPNNYNSQWLLGPLLSDQTQRPLLNRATQGSYPPGSSFKIVTMSAALNSGLYTPQTTYDCGYTFQEIPGLTLYDWTYDLKVPPSGLLTLPEGLMRSCNPFFYHIGLDLYRHSKPTIVSDTARQFGLGSPTGIDAVAEDGGSIPDPQSESDAVQMAIGQGQILVTPLQMADLVAAVGNGGTLYRPQVIEKVVNPDGQATASFQPQTRGQLPLTADNLKVLQDAMLSVTQNKRGTAYYPMLNLGIPIYGKTGTAQNPFGDAHAWFVGYTNAKRPNKPDIAVAVLAENAGEGSEVAAPIFRRIVEDYFYGQPMRLYPWESTYYVTQTPTGEVTATPTPSETATPPPASTQTPAPPESPTPQASPAEPSPTPAP